MSFVLSKENVLEHLRERQIEFEASSATIEPKLAKNFNLLVTSDRQQFLVKQEPHTHQDDRKGDLYHEWKLHQVIQTSGLKTLHPLISELMDYDVDRDIAVFRYLPNYRDLSEFYDSTSDFPTQIAIALGRTLATIHHGTIDQTELQTIAESAEDDVEESDRDESVEHVEDFGLLTPACLGTTSTAGLKFYQLYQRYESLGQAIAHLNETIEPCCLTHQDLKLNNILLHQHWAKQADPTQTAPNDVAMIRLIDWEKWEWGEPAADLGALVADYLKLWLQSLLISRGMDIELSLRLAERPLEQLQPSLISLVAAYLQQFPGVIDRFPNFLSRVMQFAGLSLIESIRASLHYYEPFGNCEICLLQVAKSLLCSPIAAFESIFGQPIDTIANAPLEFSPVPLETASPILHSVKFPEASHQSYPGWQLINSPNNISSDSQNWLIDIAQKIKIYSPARIEHCDYEPLHLPESIEQQYQQLPPALQTQHLSCQLWNYLYRIYWSGEQVPRSAPSNPPLLQPLQNDQYRGINAAFYTQLHQANQGTGYWDPDWQVEAMTQTGWIVQKQGLKLWIDADRFTQQLSDQPRIGDRITIQLPKNRIEERYYVAIGNAGGVNHTKILQICFNLPETAIALAMQQITQALNPLQIPFNFAVRFDPADYVCRDTGILEIAASHYNQVRPILEQLYQTERSAFRPEIPQFMKALAPGIGLAEKPIGDSLGEYCCRLIAEALIQCWQQGHTTSEAKIKAIQQGFEQQGLDWQYPYLNPGSTDIYEFQVMFEQQ